MSRSHHVAYVPEPYMIKWGGWGSNPLPTDYETANDAPRPSTCAYDFSGCFPNCSTKRW
jgi:hypothetical protein